MTKQRKKRNRNRDRNQSRKEKLQAALKSPKRAGEKRGESAKRRRAAIKAYILTSPNESEAIKEAKAFLAPQMRQEVTIAAAELKAARRRNDTNHKSLN